MGTERERGSPCPSDTQWTSQDGFDALCKHTANEIQFCKDTLKFFKKRIEIEETYAKSLNKLSQKSEYASTNHRCALAVAIDACSRVKQNCKDCVRVGAAGNSEHIEFAQHDLHAIAGESA